MDEHRTSTGQLIEEIRNLEPEEALARLRDWVEEVPVDSDVRHELIRLCLASNQPGSLKVAARQLSIVLLERRLAGVR